MASKSKSKGNRYERQVADFLTNQYGDSFVRVPNSGAFIGGSNASRRSKLTEYQNKAFKGDIIPPDDFNIIIECKNYEKITGGLAGLIRGDSKQVNKWLKELRGDAGELEGREQLDKHILFLKLTRVGEWFIVPAWMISEASTLPQIKYYFEDEEYIIFDITYFDNLKKAIRD